MSIARCSVVTREADKTRMLVSASLASRKRKRAMEEEEEEEEVPDCMRKLCCFRDGYRSA